MEKEKKIQPKSQKTLVKTMNIFIKKYCIEFPEISEEKERLTRNWLKHLNLTVYKATESNDILHDPYRNGLLLCEVFNLICIYVS